MNESSVLVRVNTLRSSAGGGFIFAGVEVDANGGRIDAKEHLVVRAAHWMIQAPVEPGQVWRVRSGGSVASPSKTPSSSMDTDSPSPPSRPSIWN